MDIIARYSKTTALLVDLQITAAQLAKALLKPNDKRRSVSSAGRVGKAWALADRLTEADIKGIINCKQAGTAITQIGLQFGISESSVKRILRNIGPSRDRTLGSP